MGVSVAEVTGYFSMHTRIGGYLGALLVMTGQALAGQFAGQGDFQWFVRVVAAVATDQLIVGATGMTVSAGGNVVGTGRAMLGVAVETIDSKLMGSAIFRNLLRFEAVTLDTIIHLQGCGKQRGTGRNQQYQRQQKACQELTGYTRTEHENLPCA